MYLVTFHHYSLNCVYLKLFSIECGLAIHLHCFGEVAEVSETLDKINK